MMNIKKTILNMPGVKGVYSKQLHNRYKLLEKNKRKNYEEYRYKPAENDNAPLVSVIIFIYDWESRPEILLDSFSKCYFYENVEYVFVNYSSSNAIQEYLKKRMSGEQISVIDNNDNLPCSKVLNLAAAEAKGDYLLFIDSLMQVTDGWIDELLKTVNKVDNAGVIGGKIIYADMPEEAVDKEWKICSTGSVYKPQIKDMSCTISIKRMNNGAASYEAMDGIEERIGVSENMFMVSKSTFNAVKCFDERYMRNNYTHDLFLKLCSNGYNNIYCDDCLIYNIGERVSSLHEFRSDKKIKKTDMEIFKGRWQRWLCYNDKGAGFDRLSVLDSAHIDICGAMPDNETTKFWGDYHYALALKKEFEKKGYRANILSREKWYNISNSKYVIVLRGLKEYYPEAYFDNDTNDLDRKKYIMWNISHPADVSINEFNEYDYVFFASKYMQDLLKDKISVKTGVLMQCTDPEVMKSKDGGDKKYELLFVGNSRKVYRRILKDLLPTDYSLTVYGRHWEDFPVHEYVAQDYIDNNVVGQAYHDAKILLNDHWDDMKEYGIISNRIFDALSAGAFVLSDNVPGIDEILEGNVVTYDNREDLKQKIDYYMKHDSERDKKAHAGQTIVRKQHTFANRVDKIIEVLKTI